MVRLTDYNPPNGEEGGGGHYDVREEDNQVPQPHYMTGFSRGQPSHFYVNGDVHFCRKKIVLNPRHYRDFNHYMDYLTDKIKPPFGAVRQVCTPQHGHRINNFEQLQPGGSYVVVGNGKFRRFPYDQITSTERRRSPPRNYDADPVVHSKIYRGSGRVKKTVAHSKIIKVSANGKGQKGPRIVLLSWRVPWTLISIMNQVDDMLRKDCDGPVKRLYLTTGIQVMDIDQINHMGHYVALRKSDHFKKGPYLENAVKSMQVSPRPGGDGRFYLEPLLPRSNNSTSQSSPDHSNVSTQNGSVNGYSRHKARRRDKEENQVFPAKPIKHTRSSEKRQPVDLDKDDGGKFRAKQRNSNTVGAREVEDSRDTKVDVPIDQQEARQIEEERIKRREKNKDNHRPRPEQQQQQQQQQPPRNEYPRGGVQSKPNSKRPPQPVAPRNNNNNNKNDNNTRGTEHLKYKDEEIRRHKAATKIQAGYRGYRVRKQYPRKHTNKTPQSPKARRPSRQERTPPPRQRPRPRTPSQRKESPQQRQVTPVRESGWTPESLNKSETNDFDESDKAATKIQANFRGYQTRKQLKAKKELQKSQREVEDEANNQLEKENEAATRIQANFKGYKVRKEQKTRDIEKDVDSVKEKAQTPDRPQQQNDDDDLDDLDDDFEKANAAATKIQSSYRGYRVRKDMKANRGAA